VLRLTEECAVLGGIMDSSKVTNLCWYAIHTHLNQENRTEANLKVWNVETFFPKIKEQRSNQFSGALSSLTKPFFSRYIFARFDFKQSLQKGCFTRGVHSVVSFGGSPTPVEGRTAQQSHRYLRARDE
jgi:transcription antitermination factor NusG